MALTPSWPGPTGLATTTDGRKALAGLIVKDTAGVARHGVFPAHDGAIVSARADLNVDIAAFTAAAVQFGGPVLFSNDGTAQLPSVLTSPVSGTNWYVIYAKNNESTSPGTDPVGEDGPEFGAVVSTSSFANARTSGARLDGSGTGLPTGAEELATVQLPTGKTATNASGVTITQTFQYTAAAGGTVWVRNSTERDAWTPADGNTAYQIDTDTHYDRSGGVWDSGDSGWTPIATFGSGWAATAGHPPRVRKIGNRVDLAGAVTRTTGSYSDILTIPVGFRLGGTYTNWFVGAATTSTGTSVSYNLTTLNKLEIPTGYHTAPAANPQVHPLIGTWYTD